MRRLPAAAALMIGATLGIAASSVAASTLAPPMLDISKQCELASGRNATAMSECVVAESIARSDLFRKWDKLADADVQRCLKANHKVKRRPYSALAKCLAVADADSPAPPPPDKK